MNTESISQLINELLDPKNTRNRNDIIGSLARLGEPVVLPLIEEVKTSGYKGRRALLYKVFKEIGPPQNEPILPYVANSILDVNHPGWDDAAGILVMAGIQALPHIKKTIRSYIQEHSENGFELQGIVGILDMIDLSALQELREELTGLQQITPIDHPAYGWIEQLMAKIK